MPAVHREIVYYLLEQVEPKKVLVTGTEAEKSGALFPSQCKVDTRSLTEFTSSNTKETEAFDSIVVNNAFTEVNYKQLEEVLGKLLFLVRSGGFVIVRQYIGESKLNLVHFTEVFDTFRINEPSGKFSYGFKICWEQGLRDTIYSKLDWQDHCWMLVKTQFDPVSHSGRIQPISVRDFLDRHQYTQRGIKSYEWIFGHGFISPGGEQQNAEFLAKLALKPGQTVLDIGCGIGGNAFQIAKEYGAHVIGVDLSSNMVNIACERACLKKDTRVRFLIADITQYEFPPNTFDVVYSRDCIIHIPDKSALFKKIFKWLKPGGNLLITDYMVGEKEYTKEFKSYLADRQYALRTLQDYVNAAKSAGFANVAGQDITDQLRHLIEVELTKATENEQEFKQMFPDTDYDHLVQGWKNKVGYIGSGDQKWGVITAEKPS